MQFRQNIPKRNAFLLIVIFMCLLMIWSCFPSEDSTSGTGALSFNIVYHDRIDGTLRSDRSEAAEIDCAGQGIAIVEAKVYDSNGNHLADGGPWYCNDKEGIIHEVPRGSNRTVVVFGKDADGIVILSGQKSGIAVNTGSENNPVTVDCYDFLSTPADEAQVKQYALALKWQTVFGTAGYRVFVSQNNDMSDPVIEADSDTANYAPSGLIPMATYYWQVFADDMDGNELIASQIQSFTVAGVLPDTGQNYDDPDVVGEDGNYTINPPAYTKLDSSGNDLPPDADDWAMVRDDITGLIWEVKSIDDNLDIHYVGDTYTWQNAQDVFIERLNEDEFGGYTDWRLPTIKELFVLGDKKLIGPAFNTDYFSVNPDCLTYWSSTTYELNPVNAWINNFASGASIWASEKIIYAHSVRAVRGGQQKSILKDNGNGTVTDTATGLMWQQYGPADTEGTLIQMTWKQALDYCEDLELAGKKDWRLPNVNELQSIVDYSLDKPPAINTTIFPDAKVHVESGTYWSSTSAANKIDAVNLFFYNGDVWGDSDDDDDINPDKTKSHYVRAVRGGT